MAAKPFDHATTKAIVADIQKAQTVVALTREKFEKNLKRLERCENCGAKANHRTDPLFGDGPPNFTCASEKDVVSSDYEY